MVQFIGFVISGHLSWFDVCKNHIKRFVFTCDRACMSVTEKYAHTDFFSDSLPEIWGMLEWPEDYRNLTSSWKVKLRWVDLPCVQSFHISIIYSTMSLYEKKQMHNWGNEIRKSKTRRFLNRVHKVITHCLSCLLHLTNLFFSLLNFWIKMMATEIAQQNVFHK